VYLAAMGYGDTNFIAETRASNIVTDTANRFGLKGEDWKIIFARPYTGGDKKQFLIHFTVYSDQEIDPSRFYKIPDKVPA
jgi:hypothetical protein